MRTPRPVLSRPAVLGLLGLVAVSALAGRHFMFVRNARALTGVVFPGGLVRVEVAVSRAERETGLAGRDSLPPDTGMLFVYPDTRQRRFTTEGMRFSLDIVSLSADGVVTGIMTRGPGEPGFHTAPARFVLEIPAGWAAAHGVTAGTRVLLQREGGTGP